MKTFFKNIIVFTNVIFAFSLLLIKLGAYIPPSSFILLPFITLAFPFILVVNAFFIILWLFSKHKRYSLISTVCIIICWGQVKTIYQPTNFGGKSSGDYKILSYNVNYFSFTRNHYNINARDNIMKLIREEQPDIICFQEYRHNLTDRYGIFDSLKNILNNGEYFINYKECTHYNDCYGIATFTKFPIINSNKIEFDGTRNKAIYVDVIINKDTVRIYNLHLQSFQLMRDDFDNLSKIKNMDKSSLRMYSKYFDVLSKLRYGFLKRELQADILAQHISNSKYPIIVCGDFNDVPSSYVYQTIKSSQKLKDAFEEGGFQFNGSYAGRLPSFRIDHILHSSHFESSNYKIVKEIYSDHYPVFTEISFIEK